MNANKEEEGGDWVGLKGGPQLMTKAHYLKSIQNYIIIIRTSLSYLQENITKFQAIRQQ